MKQHLHPHIYNDIVIGSATGGGLFNEQQLALADIGTDSYWNGKNLYLRMLCFVIIIVINFTFQRSMISNKSVRYTASHTYLLTPRSRVLLEKLTGSAASLEIPSIFGTRRYSQVPATCPFPEPTPSSPHNPLPLPEDPS